MTLPDSLQRCGRLLHKPGAGLSVQHGAVAFVKIPQQRHEPVTYGYVRAAFERLPGLFDALGEPVGGAEQLMEQTAERIVGPITGVDGAQVASADVIHMGLATAEGGTAFPPPYVTATDTSQMLEPVSSFVTRQS